MKPVALTVCLALLALPASAQQSPAPADNVTVTGAREAAIAKFVETRAAATRFAGKIARWQSRICPMTYGIPPSYAKFVTDKLKEVAKAAGAKTTADPACKVNIQIVFTTSPQALMDNIRKEHPVYLGYHDNSTQAEQMTQLKRPVHAFYTTQTADYRGNRQIDTKRRIGIGDVTFNSAPPIASAGTPGPDGSVGAIPDNAAGMVTMNLSGAVGMATSGTRFLGDGIQAEFNHIVIVVNTNKVIELEMGTLGDYIAMLALGQPERFDACQDLPSITNMMIDPACPPATTVTAISPHDISYLQGLYKMSIAGALNVQKSQIRYTMKQSAEGEAP
ncbi:MAG: hypothetical protein V4601_06285 [Pseudomonadota bacterium]